MGATIVIDFRTRANYRRAFELADAITARESATFTDQRRLLHPESRISCRLWHGDSGHPLRKKAVYASP